MRSRTKPRDSMMNWTRWDLIDSLNWLRWLTWIYTKVTRRSTCSTDPGTLARREWVREQGRGSTANHRCVLFDYHIFTSRWVSWMNLFDFANTPDFLILCRMEGDGPRWDPKWETPPWPIHTYIHTPSKHTNTIYKIVLFKSRATSRRTKSPTSKLNQGNQQDKGTGKSLKMSSRYFSSHFPIVVESCLSDTSKSYPRRHTDQHIARSLNRPKPHLANGRREKKRITNRNIDNAWPQDSPIRATNNFS